MPRRDWTRDELIVAFNLYCRIPFGRIHIRNPEIKALASALGRTPSSVSWKLANFARLDPALQKRQIRGAAHGANAEEKIWNEFSDNWDSLAYESQQLLAEFMQIPPMELLAKEEFPEGRTRDAIVKARVNQSFFRSAVLAAYDSQVCRCESFWRPATSCHGNRPKESHESAKRRLPERNPRQGIRLWIDHRYPRLSGSHFRCPQAFP